jgi:glucose/arabinose dehydrogenase
VLVLTKTAGFRHASIPQGVAALRALGEARQFTVDATEEAGRFTDADLGGYRVVVFLNTTGDVLEDGLMGRALDPGLATNHWLYLFNSAPDKPEQRISRFTLNGDTLDLGSEKVVLTIPTQRQQCCHSGGHLPFGPDGKPVHWSRGQYQPV